MIGDSEIMGNVQKKGITFDSFAELARKHVDIEAFKAQHSSLEQFTNCDPNDFNRRVVYDSVLL